MHCFIILHKGHFTCGMGSLWYRQQLEEESALKNRRGRIYSGGREKQIVVYFPGSGFRTYIRRANCFDAPAVTLHTLMKYGNYSHMKALLDTVGGKGIKQIWLYPKIPTEINSSFHKHILVVYLLQSIVCQLILEKKHKGKVLWLRTQLFPLLPENVWRPKGDRCGKERERERALTVLL